jgi:hypothetical protein
MADEQVAVGTYDDTFGLADPCEEEIARPYAEPLI